MNPQSNKLVYEGETLDDLIIGGYKLIQPRQGYRFSIDAVLLAHFPDLKKVKQAVDLGCGNGVISLLLSARSATIKVTGIEIQEAMVKRAQRSVEYNLLQEQVEIIRGDLQEIEKCLPAASTDLVLSNPPFWSREEGHISKNPEDACARHEIAMDLTGLIRAAAYLLRPGGSFCLIHRAERLTDIVNICTAHKLAPVRLRTVHSFWQDESKLILLEAQKREQGRLKIMPPLVIYNKPGEYSEEINRLYYAGEER
ncbi:MAG: tRNA1(Val) (adenine(37)-N6)-methyltransferase [Syntrophomonadaceae bacterium]|nr:tRNA1(Val) (adenine(37)-N6)-methyltransferase [Syntrophomonadaceae bacterium]NLX02555.1 tRNA1(Val) (adenine(37)-N6)-methyltransferase [Syntrophomonadaceae bacterium]